MQDTCIWEDWDWLQITKFKYTTRFAFTVHIIITVTGSLYKKSIDTCSFHVSSLLYSYAFSYIKTFLFPGASRNTVDLLPQGEPWTKDLTPIEGHEAAYKFDGKTAVNVNISVNRPKF